MPSINRWWIAVAGVCMQMALGAGYAWSVFRIPLVKEFGWSISQVSLTFTISWFFLGACRSCRRALAESQRPANRRDDGRSAVGRWRFSGEFFRSQIVVAVSHLRRDRRNRAGLGLHRSGAVLVKWFPERRGLITGIAVGGFGAGSLIAAPVAAG